MKIKVYGSSCASTRKSRRWFNAHNIPYIYRDIMRHPLSVDEIQHILRLTEAGTEEIISTRSKIYKELDLNLETLPLKKLYKLIQEFPRLVRHPLIFDDNKLQVGFDEHNIRQFIPREERKKLLFESLFSFNQDPQIEGI
ncbi:transcriptional regulator Spx [Pseudogracilibacillus sp. SE30717A]|uniref:transcriptional regulator Spx n=1 Tax=Pseudogracilibacillus sp. SE30717A TaxID=3098293 RepID=UPI00300DC6D0